MNVNDPVPNLLTKLLLLRLYPFINIHYYFQRCSNLENKLKDAITESDFEFIDVGTLNNFAHGSAVRCGKLVIVCFNVDGTTSTPGQGTFFILPENFRPSENKYGNGVFASSSTTDVNLTNRPLYVDTLGNVCNQSTAAVYRGGGTIAYIK